MAGMFEEAEALERRGELRAAVEAYARLTAAGEGGAEALMRQALIRRQCGEIAGPIALLRQAAEAAPRDPYPHMRLGQVAEGLRRHAVSAGHYRDACAADPASEEMRVNLAAAVHRVGWFDVGRQVARAIAPDVGDWWAGVRRLGLSAYAERRREALADLKARPRPLDRDAAWTLARHFHHLGRLKLARRLCEGMIAGDPGWFWPVWLLADITAREAGADAALAWLRGTGWPGRGSPECLEAEARLMLEAGRYADFLERLEAEPPATERRERVHEAAVASLYVLERDAALRRYCLDWLAEAPKLATPASFVAVIEVRRAATAPAEALPAWPRPRQAHLMQFWAAPDVPADVAETMASWTRLHPGWSHTVFDAERAEAFLHERLGEDAARAFRLCHHPAMMADMFRVAFLSVEGGFYVDADERCLAPLTDILPAPDAVELVAPHSGGIPGFVDNNFIGCRPGSAVCRATTAGMVEDILRAAEEGWRPDIWQVTGPGALTRGVAQHLAAEGGAAGGEAASRSVVLLPMQQYRAFVRTENELDYKRLPAANWRLAELA